jgi:hypothetical protein
MKRKLYVLRLLTIALMILVAVYPILAKPGDPKGKQKERYDVDFIGVITGSGTAGVVNQWGMGIYGMNRITLTFTGSDWNGELKGDPIDFSGVHENGELGLHTKDKGETVRMNFGFKMDDYQHAFVFEARGKVVGPWMGDSFSIVFTDTPATIRYKRSPVWDGQLTFTIVVTKPA